jgi:hypothetical protein
LHRPVRKKYTMKKVIVGGVNIQIQMDLIDMQEWSKENDGYRYILLAVDCFSRFAYAKGLKNKTGIETAQAVEEIIDEAEAHIDRKISKIQADQGTEFYNKHVKQFLDSRYIVLFSTKSPTKAQMVGRLIRTLLSRQERYNTFKGKIRWKESFPLFVNSYNKTHHSALPGNMVPFDVNLKNEKKVRNHLYMDTLLKSPRQRKLKHLSQGDPVRLSKRKKTFEKSIYQNWTDEIFYVSHVSKKTTPVTYRLEDSNEEPLESVFYRQEITRSHAITRS